jgi:hypothetical protein
VPSDDPLKAVVELLGDSREAHPNIRYEACALGRDRGANLGSAGDSLDEHLDLVALQELRPHGLTDVRFQSLLGDTPDLIAVELRRDSMAFEGALKCADHSGALQRTDDRLLGGGVNQTIHTRSPRHALGDLGTNRQRARAWRPPPV